MLPDSLLGAVCTFLSLREAVLFLAHVVRRPDVPVPWSTLDCSSSEAFRAVKIVSHLRNLSAVLSSETLDSVVHVLAHAQQLTRVHFYLMGSFSLLRALSPATTSDLAVSLCLPDRDHEYQSLVDFLTRTPLTDLTLDVTDDWWLVHTLRALPPTLRRLSLSGSVHSTVFVEAQPRLLHLSMYLDNATLETAAALCGLTRLETCWFALKSLAQAKFIEKMPSLRQVHLEVAQGGFDGQFLLVPAGVQDFSCVSLFNNYGTPGIKFASDQLPAVLDLPAWSLVRTGAVGPGRLIKLKTALHPEFASFELLWSYVANLRSLELEVFDVETQQLVENSCPVLPSVCELVLVGSTCDGLAWMRAFPNLGELTLKPWKGHFVHVDRARADWTEAFRVCPKLTRFRHERTTINRRDDGSFYVIKN